MRYQIASMISFLKNLEHLFDDQTFSAADAFTIADILMVLVLRKLNDQQILTPYADVRAIATGAWCAPHGSERWRSITHVSSATDWRVIISI